MRISDWSSDMCSSDLEDVAPQRFVGLHDPHRTGAVGNIALRDRIGAEDVIDLAGLDVDQVDAITLLAVAHARHPRTHRHIIAFDEDLRRRAVAPIADAPARSDENTSEPPITKVHIECGIP